MVTVESVKMEQGLHIKPDPATASTPSAFDEDDYEDTGELEIPKDPNAKAWLTRLPDWLWEAWADIAEDEEIELGKVYVEKGTATPEIKIVLKDIPGHAKVPKRYTVNMNKGEYSNTVVFSEKEQPGFRANVWGRERRMQKERESRRDNYKVSKKPFRSSIPKQTKLAERVSNEVTMTAVENEEYRRLRDARFKVMFKPKNTTTYDPTVEQVGMVNNSFATFNRPTERKAGKKRQQDKAVRMPLNELMDNLFACFKEFRYWSSKALMQRLRQPETYIKANLDSIAVLIRAGTFNNNYKLKDEYEQRLNVDPNGIKDEKAEEGDTDMDIKDEDDDEGEDDFDDDRMDE